MKYHRKVKGEQVLIVQMDQHLKTKNISDVLKQLFCGQCKDKFLLETRKCKKNRKQYHIQNQSKFFTWYPINDLECTVQNTLISLFELHMKSKKQVKYQQNLFLEKRKAVITETLHLVTNVFEDYNFSRKVLVKKDQVSASKGVQKQRLQLAKFFVTCKNFMLLSKENPQMKMLGSQSSVSRDPDNLFWPAQK